MTLGLADTFNSLVLSRRHCVYTDRYSVRNNEHSKERVSMKIVQLSAVNGHQNTKTLHNVTPDR